VRAKIAALISLLVPPFFLKNYLLTLLGWKIKGRVRIGFSYISAKKVSLSDGVVVGHGNLIKVDGIFLSEQAEIQHFNRIVGPFLCVLKKRACIGTFNLIKRATKRVVWGRSMLKLGILTKVTSHHVIDCSRPVFIGDYSILAGRGSQLWTHGYVHAPVGAERFRVDGGIKIGSNVYIGSSSVFNPGVRVVDHVSIGAHSSVAKSLLKSGLYVSQALRHIPQDYEQIKSRYPSVAVKGLVEEVVHKRLDPL